jgi:predicted nuclease of predicted toxin-antitoxin system
MPEPLLKFLIDNGLSPAVADALRLAGYDAVHVGLRGLAAASDELLFDLAAREGRTIVSVDTDFGTLLATRNERFPSVILFRRTSGRRPSLQVSLLLSNLDQLHEALFAGSIVVFSDSRIRVRKLPISAE